MAQDTRTRLENRIKKLQQLHDLLGDPDISAEMESLYSNRNGAASAEPRNPPAMRVTTRTSPAPKRSKRGNGRKMTRRAVEIVNGSLLPITARDVADKMTNEGFNFKSGNKYIAVSKALRRVSEDNEINAQPGPSPKSPILYSRKA